MEHDVADPKGNLTARYPREFKETVVQYAERFNNREAERMFGIAESNIRRWRKLKSMLLCDGLFSDRSDEKRGSASSDEAVCTDGEVGSAKDDEKQQESGNVTNRSEMPQKPNSNNNKLQDHDEVCLRWNSHHHNMKSMFPILLQREQYVDATLTSEGKTIKCHKLILSSCSTYFNDMLCDIPPNQHAIIFLNTVPFWLLKMLVDFMYTGEVHIDQNKLQDLLRVAEILQIKGLTGNSKDQQSPKSQAQKPAIHPSKPPGNATQQRPAVSVPPPPLKPKSEPKQIKAEDEGRIPAARRDVKQQPVNIKVIKLQNTDTMPLLKPIYMEDNGADTNKAKESPKKVGVRRTKKRKSSEHEPSPPPILFRKGTKSRPHVKVPKYYHNDYEDLDTINALKLLQNSEEVVEKSENNEDGSERIQCDLDRVKIEPLDIDETEVLFNKVSEKEASMKRNDRNLEASVKDHDIAPCE